jgi:hypothetical protein
MRIRIQTWGTAGTELETDRELHRAFNVLHNALIQTRGGGRFADSSAAIILAFETDAPGALGPPGTRAPSVPAVDEPGLSI